jgi:hypothetical protein
MIFNTLSRKMKVMNKQFYISLLFSLMTTVSIIAQQPVNQDVKVVKEYDPTVSDAMKIDMMPVLDDTSTYRPSFNYTILSRAFQTAGEVEPIGAARMAPEKRPMLSNSLIRFGLGTYNSMMGELDYNILRSKNYALALNLNHQSSWGKLILEDDNEVDAPYHYTNGDLRFRRFFNNVTLSTDLSFLHRQYQYYGLQTLQSENEFLVPGYTDPISGSSLMPDVKQRVSSFGLKLGLASRNIDLSDFIWKAGLGFSSYGNRTGVHQNRFDLSTDIHIPGDALHFNIGAEVAAFKTSIPDSIGPLFWFRENQTTNVKLFPTVLWDFDFGKMELGLYSAILVGGEKEGVDLAPHAMVELTVAEGIVSLFGGITGQQHLNDYATIQLENPFVSPDLNVKSSFYGINLRGGLKGNFSSKVAFAAQVDYSIFNDEHFYVNRRFENADLLLVPHYEQSNLFGVVYDDGSLLKISGELLVQPDKRLNIKLKGTYFGWNLDTEAKAWHKPESEIKLTGIYHASRGISFDAGITYLGPRYAKTDDPLQFKTLKSIVDVNAGVQYRINNRWGAWGRLNNLAVAKYYQWNGYPSQGINFMVGTTYSF